MNFSVVIPLYNKGPYVQRAINSVLNQTLQDFEIIVVNDGSTDNGQEVVEVIQDPRIRLINQPNQGVSVARNRGIEEAHYPFIAFLDADDEWKPEFLAHIQRLYNNFSDCGAYATFYEEFDFKGEKNFPPLGNIPPEPWIGILPNLFMIFQGNILFCASSIVITKRALTELGGFPKGIPRGEDIIMWIRLGMRYPIAYSPSRQAIYHTEAANRVCVIFPSDNEGAHTRMITEMLENGEIPIDLLHDVMDYCAQEQINKAKEMILAGHSNSARQLLGKAKNNRKYHQTWLWWYFWSFVPYRVLDFARRMYHRKELA